MSEALVATMGILGLQLANTLGSEAQLEEEGALRGGVRGAMNLSSRAQILEAPTSNFDLAYS
eukprot:5525294-Pyramimonas_sp.AAC.1